MLCFTHTHTHTVSLNLLLVLLCFHFFSMSRNPTFLCFFVLGSISIQLAAVSSTMQPNCSFSILCFFSECQNTRMCNQGWALDEARQISQHCRPSLLRRWSSDAREVCFLYLFWSLKMKEIVTLNWRRYASHDSVSALIITHHELSVNFICARVDPIFFYLSWLESVWMNNPTTTTAHQR